MRFRGLVAVAGTVVALAAAPAASAAVTFGSDLNLLETPSQRPASEPGTASLTETPPASTAEGGTSAPFDGVVVRWRIRTTGGTANPPGADWTARFRLLSVNTAAAFDEPVQIADVSAIQTFPTRLPVRAGEDLGLDTPGTESFWTVPGSGLSSMWRPPLGLDETRSPFLTPVMRLMLNADVEPDADGDGFGDETQDGCPSDPSTHDACDRAAPETTITKPPKRKLKKRKATVEFSSDDPAAAFECALDSASFEGCTSPLVLKRLKPGKHSLGVRAVDGSGNVDRTAAIAAFKVKRR